MSDNNQNLSNNRFNAKKLINLLSSMTEEDKNKKAQTNNIIKEELEKVLDETRFTVQRQNREEAIKYALWQGLLNQYGIFGSKRKMHKNSLYDNTYIHGDLISIDFGTSNIGAEFSYTHTAIVLKSYTDYVVVLPITSNKEGRLENKPQDEQADTMLITNSDFSDIESDSYIMLYQIRSVSKNRIQKVIGTISNSTLMKEIDRKLMNMYIPYIQTEYDRFLSIMEEKDKLINEKDAEISELREKMKKLLTHPEIHDNIPSLTLF